MLDLSGPKLKLARANNHIRELENTFETFICNTPYRLEVTNLKDDEKVRELDGLKDEEGIVIKAVFDREIPFETSAIIGDAVHNLRSSLDHLASIAISHNAGKVEFNSGFPIYKNKSDLKKNITKKLRGAHPAFIDFVRQISPCLNGKGKDNRIYILSKLNNLDKHNSLIPTAGVFEATNIVVTDKNGKERLVIGTLKTSGGGIANIGCIVGEGLKMTVDPDATIKVMFKNTGLVDGAIIIDVLKDIHSLCSDIIKHSGRFIEGNQ